MYEFFILNSTTPETTLLQLTKLNSCLHMKEMSYRMMTEKHFFILFEGELSFWSRFQITTRENH
jgi:hypothetical protein